MARDERLVVVGGTPGPRNYRPLPARRGLGWCTWRPPGGGARLGPSRQTPVTQLAPILGAQSQGGGCAVCVRVARCGARVCWEPGHRGGETRTTRDTGSWGWESGAVLAGTQARGVCQKLGSPVVPGQDLVGQADKPMFHNTQEGVPRPQNVYTVRMCMWEQPRTRMGMRDKGGPGPTERMYPCLVL